MLLKTSVDWMKDYINNFTIAEPNGWDKKNYKYSWFIEKISLAEFQNRVMKSTIICKGDQRGIFSKK
jgi:hypothetical protein